MTLTIPPFLKLTHDVASKKATFEVEDATIARQRAMWGELPKLEGSGGGCVHLLRCSMLTY